MTVGAPDQLCRCPIHCTPGPRGVLDEANRRLQAARYAATLTDGEEIDGDYGGTDYEFTQPFAKYLPEALSAAGFRIIARLDRKSGRMMTQVRCAPITDARPQTEETTP